MLQIKLNKDGYVEEFMLPNSEGTLPNGIEVDEKNIDIEDFQEHFQAYKYEDGKLFRDEDIFSNIKNEKENNELRYQREKECFSFINRGWLWYSTLTATQLSELTQWYKDWLNVTKTKTIPNRPSWLD